MLKYTNEEWDKCLISNDLHKMFVFFWDECLSDSTPDTWQTRTSNFKSVLHEIIEAVDVAREHEKYKHNIPVLLDEARQMMESDPVIRAHFPLLQKLLPDSSNPLVEIQQKAVVILERLQNYQKLGIAALRSLLAAGEAKQKSELNALTMAIAVEWSTNGYSHQYLRDGINCLLDNRIPDFLERFDKFIDRCDGKEKDYTCQYMLTWPVIIALDAFDPADIHLTKGPPTGPHCAQSSELYGNALEHDIFGQVAVRALDPTSAERMGEERIAAMFAAINLYLVHKRLDFKGRGAIVRSDSETATFVPIERVRRTQIRAPQNPVLHANEFFRVQGNLHSSDQDQIRSALQYHMLSLVASTDESKLVNLWIAIECIARRANQSIIDVVCDHISPSVAVGNIAKQVNSLINYTAALWQDHRRAESAQIFPRSEESRIDEYDLLDALLDIEDGPKITELYRISETSPLLRFRIFRTRKHLSSQSAAAAMMKAHERNVNWQLRRIYRARNNLIHRGKRTLILPKLIQHLHVYFVAAMTNLIGDLSANPKWRVPNALYYRSLLFHEYIEILSGKRNYPISKDALLNPSLLFERNHNHVPAWPDKKDAEKSEKPAQQEPPQ